MGKDPKNRFFYPLIPRKTHNLSTIGILAEAPIKEALLRYKVHGITEKDLFIGIRFRRCNRHVVETLLEAKQKKAAILVITYAAQTPLARFADNSLLAAINSH